MPFVFASILSLFSSFCLPEGGRAANSYSDFHSAFLPQSVFRHVASLVHAANMQHASQLLGLKRPRFVTYQIMVDYLAKQHSKLDNRMATAAAKWDKIVVFFTKLANCEVHLISFFGCIRPAVGCAKQTVGAAMEIEGVLLTQWSFGAAAFLVKHAMQASLAVFREDKNRVCCELSVSEGLARRRGWAWNHCRSLLAKRGLNQTSRQGGTSICDNRRWEGWSGK